MKKNIKRITIGVLLVAVIWLIACAVNPVTGQKQFVLYSEQDEIAMGQQTDAQIVAQYGVYDDPELTAYISNLGTQMAAKTHRPNLPYEFKILDTPVVNAFAVPGGYVYFTRGILGYLNNEAEFAGVLGHELGHVNARHSIVSASTQMAVQLGILAGAILSEDIAKWAPALMVGSQFLFLKFSRDDERQADDLGVIYSTKMNYNAEGMATFFETLERMHPNDASAIPEWFSTHPNPENRIVAVRKKTQEEQAKNPNVNYIINKNEYLAKVDGLIFGDDPREGYVTANAFYNPKMELTFPVPKNWTFQNAGSQVQLQSTDENALIMFSPVAETSLQTAASAFAQNNNAAVIKESSTTINGFAAKQVLADVPAEGDTLRLSSTYIQKDNTIYAFHGVSSRDNFSTYNTQFTNTMTNFSRLTDKSKMAVQPQHIGVKQVKKAGTVKQALTTLGVKADALEEIALLNGVQLTDAVKVNDRLKIILK